MGGISGASARDVRRCWPADAGNRDAASATTTEMPVDLKAADMSAIGYIDAASYLKWVQAVVILHWQRFAPPAAQASTLWIAVRHVIDYRGAGHWSDHVVARATITRLKGVRAVFTTDIAADGRALAHVESTWVSLNAETGQPKALDQAIIDLFARR